MTLTVGSLWMEENGSGTQLDWTEPDFLDKHKKNNEQPQPNQDISNIPGASETLDWEDKSFDPTWPPIIESSVEDTSNALKDTLH